MNGAPTGDAANQPPQNNNQPAPRPHPSTRNATDHMCRSGTGRHEWRPPRATPQTNRRETTFIRHKRRGATCDARITDAMPQTNRHKTTNQPAPRPHPPTRNATNHMCRSGTGRHEWRPHGRRHKPTATKQHSTARKRRGATCDARMTDEMPQTSATKRQTNRRPARIHRHATRPTTCAVPAPGVMNGAPTDDATNQPTQNRKPTIAPPASADAQRDRPHVPFRHRAS